MPEIEEREAARLNGYTWEHWCRLGRRERVAGVAYFRVRRSIEMHQADAQDQQMRREAKAAAKGRKR